MKEKNYKFTIQVAEAASRQVTNDIKSLITSIMEKSGSEPNSKKLLTRLPGGLLLPVSESSCIRYEAEHMKGWTIIGIAASADKSEHYIAFKTAPNSNFFLYLKPEDLSLTLRITVLTFLVFWNNGLTAGGTDGQEAKTSSPKDRTAKAEPRPDDTAKPETADESPEGLTPSEPENRTEETAPDKQEQEQEAQTGSAGQGQAEQGKKLPFGIDPSIKIDYSIFG